jgi:hypothetical protein
MFHIRGDADFRSNAPNAPELDVVSGLLFLIGAAYWAKQDQRRWLPVLIIPFLLLWLPSNLVLNEAHPTPSASRSLAIIPFVALLVAGGLYLVYDELRSRPWVQRPVLAGLLGLMVVLNWQRYFGEYAYNLPDHNTPYGKIIAEYIDGLPRDASALIYSCCWGSWGQPEPAGIQDILRKPRQVMFLPAGLFSCDSLNGLARPLYVIWDPREASATATPAACDPAAKVDHYPDAFGGEVFVGYYLPR